MRQRTAASALVIFTLLLGIISFPKYCYSGDPYWMRAQAWAWMSGQGDIPAAAAEQTERGQYCFFNEKTGKYYSKYGVMNSAVLIPPLTVCRAVGTNGCNDAENSTFVSVFNVYNLILSCVLALILYFNACLFSQKRLICLFWTAASMFAGFGWNYLRAQSGEIFHWIFASAFFYLSSLLFSRRDDKSQKRLIVCCWACLAALVLLKSVYWLLAAVWLGTILWFSAEDYLKENEKAASFSFSERLKACFRPAVWKNLCTLPHIIPFALLMALFLLLNWWRFGSMFANGYTQWSRETDLFCGNIWEGLTGFLFSPDKSIFIYQPLLIFALFAWPKFFKKHPRESVLVLSSFTVFLLINSKFLNWAGHWCYGPRYLLFILCQLTWPALLLAEHTAENIASWKSKLCAACAVFVLSVSFWMQIQANSLEFFTYYRAEKYLTVINAPEALKQFHRRPFGIIYFELKRLKNSGVQPVWLETACQEVPQVQYKLPMAAEALVCENYYWQ